MIGVDSMEFFLQLMIIEIGSANELMSFSEFTETDSLVFVRIQLSKEIAQLIVIVQQLNQTVEFKKFHESTLGIHGSVMPRFC